MQPERLRAGESSLVPGCGESVTGKVFYCDVLVASMCGRVLVSPAWGSTDRPSARCG